MRIIPLIITAVLALALFGCNTDKPETAQDKPDIMESKRLDAKSKARDLEPISANPEEEIDSSVRKTRSRKTTTSKRNYARRNSSRRNYSESDYDTRNDFRSRSARRDYSERDYDTRINSRRRSARRDYSERDYDVRDYDEGFYDDRGYGESNDADVGSTGAASTPGSR